jgi:rare lipoprotein A
VIFCTLVRNQHRRFTFDQLIGVLQQHFAAMPRILARRGASSEVNLGSRMRQLIAALVLCLLEIPVRAEDCVASVYAVGDSSQPGTKTASGIPLNDNAMMAAHKSLPFGSKVKVTNKKNGHAVTVTITDRGPYVKGRCIDLSKAGAGALGFAGLAPVSVVPVVSD